MTRRLQIIIVIAVWIVLAFLLIRYSFFWFGWQYTICSLLASVLILWGGKKLFEWRKHERKL